MDYDSMPIDLVFVRHGESEANLAQKYSSMGDDRFWTPEFKTRHTSKYRLTDLGREQSIAAGQWIKENIGPNFDKYLCSEYARARETAALLGLPLAKWDIEFYLRERDRGVLQHLSKKEAAESYGEEIKRSELDQFYWAAPGGESIANSCLRCDRVMSQLSQKCSGYKVIIVCHGNIMLAFKIRLERMKQSSFHQLLTDPSQKLYNCQIVHYSRRNPETGEVHPSINWVRSVCPWGNNLVKPEWKSIHPLTFSNEQLLASVQNIPQIVNNPSIEFEKETLFLKSKENEQQDELI
jgi:broad specificity phosphatase PhoE